MSTQDGLQAIVLDLPLLQVLVTTANAGMVWCLSGLTVFYVLGQRGCFGSPQASQIQSYEFLIIKKWKP